MNITRKIISVLLSLVFIVSFSACDSLDAESTNAESTNMGTVKNKTCNDAGCEVVVESSTYCDEHLKVYAREREFYGEIKKVVDTLSEEYLYSVTTNYKLKEIVVYYLKTTSSAKADNPDLPEYKLVIYAHFTLNGVSKFVKYEEWKKMFGITPAIELCEEDSYTHARKAAMGAVSWYSVKERSKHYSGRYTDIYERDEYFILDFDDYKGQGYKIE